MTENLIKIHTALLVRTSSHICRFIYPVFTIPFRPVYRALITGVQMTFCGKILVMKPQMFLFVVIDVTCDKLDTHSHTHI